MFNSAITKKHRRQFAALNSKDPNQILISFDKTSVNILFKESLNVKTANQMSDKELLGITGIGKKTVEAVRMAIRTAENKNGKKYKLPRDILRLLERGM